MSNRLLLFFCMGLTLECLLIAGGSSLCACGESVLLSFCILPPVCDSLSAFTEQRVTGLSHGYCVCEDAAARCPPLVSVYGAVC